MSLLNQLLKHPRSEKPYTPVAFQCRYCGRVEPSLAGPKRPQDRVPLKDMQTTFRKTLAASVKERGFGLDEVKMAATAEVKDDGRSATITHGAVVIAAITSCTNTSNPSAQVVQLGEGLRRQPAPSPARFRARHAQQQRMQPD